MQKLKPIPKKLKDFTKKLKVPEDFPYLILQKTVKKKPELPAHFGTRQSINFWIWRAYFQTSKAVEGSHMLKQALILTIQAPGGALDPSLNIKGKVQTKLEYTC